MTSFLVKSGLRRFQNAPPIRTNCRPIWRNFPFSEVQCSTIIFMLPTFSTRITGLGITSCMFKHHHTNPSISSIWWPKLWTMTNALTCGFNGVNPTNKYRLEEAYFVCHRMVASEVQNTCWLLSCKLFSKVLHFRGGGSGHLEKIVLAIPLLPL